MVDSVLSDGIVPTIAEPVTYSLAEGAAVETWGPLESVGLLAPAAGYCSAAWHAY